MPEKPKEFLGRLSGLPAAMLAVWSHRVSATEPSLPTMTAEWRSPGQAVVRRCPRLRIDSEAFARLHAYVEAAAGEITLLGSAEYDPLRGELWIRHLMLPEQRCTATSTIVDEEALAKVLLEAAQQSVSLNLWLHSHADMPVFFSAIDEQNIETAFPQSHYVVSLVVNRKGEMRARLTQFSPIGLEIDDLPVAVGVPADVEQAIRDEVQQKLHLAGPTQYADRFESGYRAGNGTRWSMRLPDEVNDVARRGIAP